VALEFGTSEASGLVTGGMVGDATCAADDGAVEGEHAGALEELGGGE
jgi:hypothetical protein